MDGVLKSVNSCLWEKLLGLLAWALLLTACSFPDQQPMSDVQRDLEEREKLSQVFAQVQGVYAGEIQLSGRESIPALLILGYREVAVGTDNDGQIKYRPRLIARLQRPSLLLADVKLEGVFEPATGDLTLTALANETERFYMQGRLRDGMIEAPLRLDAQTYGLLLVKRTTNIVPEETREDEAQKQRIRAHLQKLVGVYETKIVDIESVIPELEKKGEMPVEVFRLSIQEVGTRLPQLVLSYRSSKAVLLNQAPVEYRPELNPAEFNFQLPRGANQESATFRGVLRETGDEYLIEGEITYPTFTGRLVARRRK